MIDIFEVEYEKPEDGDLYSISIVQSPANGMNFITLSEQSNLKKIRLSDEKKKILTGVVLVPEQLIYREFEDGTPFNLKFSAKTIEKLSQDFMRKGYQLNSTFDHKGKYLDGICVVEQWIVEDGNNDKANALGFKDLPKGTWMVSMKLSDELWDEYIETGKAQGFSIDSFLDLKKVSMSIINKTNKKEKMSLLKRLIKMFSEEGVNLASISIEGMGELSADAFEVGNVVYKDVEGVMEPLVSSSFTYEGFIYITDESGMISEKVEDKPMEQVEMGSIKANDEAVTIYFDGAMMSLGKEVYSDEAMTMPLEVGEYVLESGVTLIVSEAGIVGELQEAIEMEDVAPEVQEEIVDVVTDIVEEVIEKPIEEVDVEALKSKIAELEMQIEILTKDKEAIISENVEMKNKLSTIPNSTKLKANEVKMSKQDSTLSVLRKVIEAGKK